MKPLTDLEPGTKIYAALGVTVLAVLSRRVDGWSIYIGGVPGKRHEDEWQEVARSGDKLSEAVATAILASHLGYEPAGLRYCR